MCIKTISCHNSVQRFTVACYVTTVYGENLRNEICKTAKPSCPSYREPACWQLGLMDWH